MQIRYITLFVIFFACASVTDSPKPDNAGSAREAFESLDEEVGVTQVEQDLTGVTNRQLGLFEIYPLFLILQSLKKVNIILVNQDG